MKAVSRALALAFVLVSITSCSVDTTDGTGIHIVATTTMLGDLARNVAGDEATVEVLMPIGADPHSFSPSSRQVASMSTADLVIVNGLGLEESFEAVIDGVAEDGVVVLEVGPRLDPLPFGVDPGEGGVGTHQGSGDPHVWLDPIRMAKAAEVISETLAEIDDSVDWSDRAASYSAELEATDSEIDQILADVDASKRVLVTNHDSLGYFANRYGFEVVGTVLPGGSTLADPSSDQLAALVGLMRERGVAVIFAETTEPVTLAEAVATELGRSVQVVELYTGSLGEPGSGADTLVGMLLTDATLIADALEGDG